MVLCQALQQHTLHVFQTAAMLVNTYNCFLTFCQLSIYITLLAVDHSQTYYKSVYYRLVWSFPALQLYLTVNNTSSLTKSCHQSTHCPLCLLSSSPLLHVAATNNCLLFDSVHLHIHQHIIKVQLLKLL